MSPELRVLHEQAWFKKFMVQVAKEAPSIRPHDPNDPQSVEKWKADSARREGFFNALSRFGYSLESLEGDS